MKVLVLGGTGEARGLAAALVDFETPETRLYFTASHEFVDDIICIPDRAIPVGQCDTGRVLNAATSIAQFESVNRHRLNSIVVSLNDYAACWSIR